jgi:hypothetical protein
MSRPPNAPKTPPPGKSKQSENPQEPQIALKPRPALFFMLLASFLIWIVLVVTMYFTTVYEKSDVHVVHPAGATLPGASGLLTAPR